MKLYTAAQMREADRRAIEERGIPSVELMENAARALVEEVCSLPIPGPGLDSRRSLSSVMNWLEKHVPTKEEQAEFWAVRQRTALVLCGPGNNGGDGIAAARMLLEMGWWVKCYLVGDREKMTDDCREMERRLVEAGGKLDDFGPIVRGEYTGEPWPFFNVSIDALFGVGLTRDLEGAALVAARMSQWNAGWVVSVDVPSGIHADTGEMMGEAVKADVTVTFSRGKPGLFVGQGAAHAGRVVVADIGIPDDLYPGKPRAMLMEPGMLWLPQRPVDGHKGDFGRLFILAGSQGYTGAAALCARAAVRGGAGLTTLAVLEDVYPIVAAKCCDEVMVMPWPDNDDKLVEKARTCTAAVIGPGLGQGERAERLVLKLMKELTCPIILDADGLNIISRHIHVLDERKPMTTVLTPHDGEFARLDRCELPIRDRLGTARAFAERHRCILVLKGHRTIITRGVGCLINSTGNSGMAKGGSGDVLAGLMGALEAQMKNHVTEAADAAVWLHGRAGDLAAEDKGEHGMTPSDLIEQIPYAFKELAGQRYTGMLVME